MGSCQSQLCAGTGATLSTDPEGVPGDDGAGGTTLMRLRSLKAAPPPPRLFVPDPAKAAQSAADKAAAVAAAEAMLAANQGRRHRDIYVRATLLSYGASCRVFTAWSKQSQEQVAIKTITKVGRR